MLGNLKISKMAEVIKRQKQFLLYWKLRDIYYGKKKCDIDYLLLNWKSKGGMNLLLLSKIKYKTEYTVRKRWKIPISNKGLETNLLFLLFFLQYINTTGVRVCLKELYETKYDPLSISYTVLSGTDKIIHC